MNPFAQIGSPTLVFFMLVVLVVSFILLMRTSRYFSRQRQDEPKWSRAARPRMDGKLTAPQTKQEHHLDAMPKTAQWEVDMYETARDMKAQLDSKMSALQALIAEADRAASRLEAATKNSEITDNMPPSNRMPSGGSPLFTPKAGPLSMLEKNQTGLPKNQAQALRPAPAATASGVLPQRRHEELYTLADHGLSDSAIAQRLAMPIGEVELILSLRAKR